MLKQASIAQIRQGELNRKSGYLVVAMCFYPRGLRRETRDEYNSKLAPERGLFRDFKENQLKFGHEEGFVRSRYEQRFQLSPEGYSRLRELAELSEHRDVYLACQCAIGERCHREMLLLLAKQKFGAKIDRVFHRYPVFMARIRKRAHPRPGVPGLEAGL